MSEQDIIMTSVYEKNIVEVRNEYTTRLSQIITPCVYEGLATMFEKACDMQKKLEQINAVQKKPAPPVIEIFEKLLDTIKQWNKDIIETETNRIRCEKNHSEWFDKLIKATVKSNIILLTSGYSFRDDRVAFKNLHNKVESNNFIHQCYICASDRITNESYLFNKTNFSVHEQNNNKKIALEHIRNAVQDAVWHSLPVGDILNEYVDIEPIVEQPINMNKMADKNIQKQLNNEKNIKNEVFQQPSNVDTKRESPDVGINKINPTGDNKNTVMNIVNRPSTYQETKQQMTVDIPSETATYSGGGKSHDSDDESDDDVDNAIYKNVNRDNTKKYSTARSNGSENIDELENYNNSVAYKNKDKTR